MAFMEAEITRKQRWYSIDTDMGAWFIPTDVPNCTEAEALACVDEEDGDTIKELLRYTEGRELNEVSVLVGYGVRLSAPGYMDCTDWEVYTNKREALRAARDLEEDDF